MKTKCKCGVRILALFTLLAFLALTVCSCQEKSGGKGSCKIVLLNGSAVEYTVDLSEVENLKGAMTVVDYLCKTDGLTYTLTGTFLESIGNLNPDANKHEYIAIYTSVERDFDVSEWGSTTEYQGKTLTSAGVGLLDLSVEDGALILFTIGSY